MREKLKPCRFCGCSDFIDHGASWDVCAECGEMYQRHAKAPTSTIITLRITGDREDAERIGALAAAQWPASVSGWSVTNASN
jgi:hypothetical protein